VACGIDCIGGSLNVGQIEAAAEGLSGSCQQDPGGVLIIVGVR
jgi:hypothetical protein